MSSFEIKKARYESMIKKTLSYVIEFDSYDEIIKQINITSVVLNNDFSVAKIYISVLDKQKFDIILEKANSAISFFKKKLSDELDFKKTPNLIFLEDKAMANFERVEDILKKIRE